MEARKGVEKEVEKGVEEKMRFAIGGSKMKLLFITSNEHKVREIRDLALKMNANIEIEHLRVAYPEIQHEDIEFIAESSAKFIRKEGLVGEEEPFFIEDSGLFIHALKGFPGAFSSYVFKKIGNEGILKLLRGVEDRRALFKSVVAFSPRGFVVKTFVGVVEGRIAFEKRGASGFGFDPIFEFGGRTFAEMSVAEKNAVSHRGRAFRKFLEFILSSSSSM